MGKSILSTVVDLIVAGGIPAAPSQPASTMRIIHTPVAAVSIESVDTAQGSATALIEMVAPMQAGAQWCQERATAICSILSAAGAECVQGGCTFNGRSALFCVPVTARFYGTALEEDWIPRPTRTVKLAGTKLSYVTSISAQQTKGEEHSSISAAPWEFTLEEFFPTGTTEPADPQEPFALKITGSEGTQTFTGCALTERVRTCSAAGTRQIRKGIATSRTVQ